MVYRIPDETRKRLIFKKEWSHVEHLGVVRLIWEEFNVADKEGIFDDSSSSDIEGMERYFGFAYTSSGVAAELSICNVEHEIEDGIFMRSFFLTDNHRVVLWATDEQDKEYYYFVG